MKKIIVLFILSLLLSCEKDKEFKEIKGEWDYFPGKFIYSDGFTDVKPAYKIIPSKREYREFNTDYGSIRKIIRVIPNKKYTFYSSGIYSASKIWIDGVLVKQYGTLGNRYENSIPEVKRDIIGFTPERDRIEIVIEFSDFHIESSRIFRWIVYGSSVKLNSKYITMQNHEYFSTGILLACSLVFLLTFFTDIKKRYNLYFSLFTFSFSLHVFLMKNTLLSILFNEFPWILIYQLNQAAEMWSVAFILLVFRGLYPVTFRNRLNLTIIVVVNFVSLSAFQPLNYPYITKLEISRDIVIAAAGIYLIVLLMISAIKGLYLAKTAFIANIIFLLSIIHDLFIVQGAVMINYMGSIMVIPVIIVMFLLIADKRTGSFIEVQKKEKLYNKLRKTFSMFVPINILNELGNEKLLERPPGDYAVKTVTIIYFDIRNFTNISEKLTSEENFILINNFYEIVGKHVSENGGYIESFGGDGVRTIFPQNPDIAIETTLKISNDAALSPDLKIGMSIHHGDVILGTIGCGERIQATAISDVTRILGNMDSFNSKFGVEILLTDSVIKQSGINIDRVLFLGNIILKNEESPTKIYQIIPDNYKIDSAFRHFFETGVTAVENGAHDVAIKNFESAIGLRSTHLLTVYYVKELKKFKKSSDITFVLKL